DVETLGDGEQPRRETEPEVEPVEVGQGAHEGVLHNVLGDLRPIALAEHVRVEGSLVSANKLLGGRVIAIGSALDQRTFFASGHARLTVPPVWRMVAVARRDFGISFGRCLHWLASGAHAP